MADVILGLLLSIAATLALVVVNGVFVAAEFAIVRVRRTRLKSWSVREGTPPRMRSSSSIA